jgi:hypothetical protein
MNFLNLKAVLSLNGSGFALGLKRAESTSKQFAKEIKGQFAQAFGAAAIIAYGRHVINLADNIIDISERLGISTKAFQEWANAAKKSGSSIEAVTQFLEQLSIAREKALEGDGSTIESFRKLGISPNDLQTIGLDQIGRKIGQTVKNGNIQELIRSLKELGGKSAGGLVPALKAIEELSQSAPIIKDEDLEKLKQLKSEALGFADVLIGPVSDAIVLMGDRLQDALSVFKIGIGGAAAFIGSLSGTPLEPPSGKGPEKGVDAYLKAMRGEEDGGSATRKALDAAMKVLDDELESRERRKRAIKESIDARRAGEAAANIARESSVLHDASPIKKAAEKVAQNSINTPSLTAWQSAGAAIRFSPDKKALDDIAKHTRETAMNTRPTNKQAGSGIGGLGAELQ